MLALALLAFAGIFATTATAKSVFAHFLVGNTASFTLSDWTTNIELAQTAKIDAFALNIAKNDPGLSQLDSAFRAAEAKGFQFFLSFDYAASGPWASSNVSALITKYAASEAYFRYGQLSKPLVSTSGGASNANEWTSIKSQTNCFFIPDWSSVDAQTAVGLANGVADGLFNWAAWPTGPQDIDTYTDASYFHALGKKPYMAAVSPWFYTNMPGYKKNWVWRGDSLWFDRWQQLIALDVQPEFVQIVSWNDFGESHYIGPVDTRQFGAYVEGNAPYNYVFDYPHDAWRELLPFFVSTWKTGKATVSSEKLVAWYRRFPASACRDGDTTGDTAKQLQTEYSPSQILQDKVFFAAVLAKKASVSVTIDGKAVSASWSSEPYGGVGVYGGSADWSGQVGVVNVTVDRIPTLGGRRIVDNCPNSFNNYNAWVGNSTGPAITPVTVRDSTSSLNCTAGFGVYNFGGLCSYSCGNGYCPSTACTCTLLGKPSPPEATNPHGYPLTGLSSSYKGLCDFACQRTYCPSTACGRTEEPTQDQPVNEFHPYVPVVGTGSPPYDGLCKYACGYGFCPKHLCTAVITGPPVLPPAADDSLQFGVTEGYNDEGFCEFACKRKYCPFPCIDGPVASSSVISPTKSAGSVQTTDCPWLSYTTMNALMNVAAATAAP